MTEIVDQAVGQIITTARTAVESVEDHYQAQLAQTNEVLLATRAALDAERAAFAAHLAEPAPAGHTTVEEPPPPPPPVVASFPLLMGMAVDDNQAVINDRQARMGPLKMSRDYERSNGVKEVRTYPWYSSIVRQLADPADDNFRYLFFSVDNPFAQTAAGTDRTQWETLLSSLPTQLPGVKGVISVGNETNLEGVDPSLYRSAVEKLIDTFGYQPVPGWIWGTAFSNFRSWGQARTEGELWLPRREDGPFAVATHIYGKDTYTPPADMLGRSFIPAMKRRPSWIWGVGETSAQEDPGMRKEDWFEACIELLLAEGGSFYLPFDTNVGGSADVGSSPTSAAVIKRYAEQLADNEWTYPEVA